ncbi:hypothetical protein DFJ73DRAFT_796516 [Zopfochytrium polystomum]|nr:hypothetical protein DFJ73DRAFT_796516 [Zopfochytrium polystomum]
MAAREEAGGGALKQGTRLQKKATRESKKHLKLFMHPPSIPTRFQTFHFDDHEPKGFNSTLPRFDKHVDELPGPGYYDLKSESATASGGGQSASSTGKSATGAASVGFASKTRRFKKPPTDLEANPYTPAPAAYSTAREPVYSHSLAYSVTSSFRQPLAKPAGGDGGGGAVPGYEPGGRVGVVGAARAGPGPGSYDAHRAVERMMRTRVAESGAVYVFKSRTRRSWETGEGKVPLPPPGAYDPKPVPRVTGGSGATAAFKSTNRDAIRAASAHPGPGSYELVSKLEKAPTKRHSKFVSVVQFIPDPAAARPPDAPGPGAYQLAIAADSIHKSRQAPNSVFNSISDRFQSSAGAAPGPGFYHPLPESQSKSFHLNLDQVWTY